MGIKKLRIIKEEILDANGKPVHMVDTNVEKPDAESGFCLHQPQIKSFALQNEVNMAILISFVMFTMQKQWQDVVLHFDNFMQWVLVTDRKSQSSPVSTSWRYDKDKESWGSLKNSGIGSGARYVQQVWADKKKIFEDVTKILESNKGNTEKDRLETAIQVWYRVIQILGLGPIKAAFTVQLMLGQLGCLDSINSIVYEPLADPKLFKRTYTRDGDLSLSISAPKDPKTGKLNTGGKKVAQKYIEFLQSIEQATKAPLSKNLWDVWCDIVAIKINQSAKSQDMENIGLILPDKSVNTGVKPYRLTAKNKESIEKYKDKLGIVKGFDVSSDHAEMLTGVRNRIGESFEQFFKRNYPYDY